MDAMIARYTAMQKSVSLGPDGLELPARRSEAVDRLASQLRHILIEFYDYYSMRRRREFWAESP